MAYTVLSKKQWTSSTKPKINITYAYQRSRSGSDMVYSFKITVDGGVTGESYFGYPINSEITLNGNIVDTHQIKGISPSQWSSAIPYTTGNFTVANALYGTVPVTFRIYSGSGNTRNESYSFDLVVDSTPSTLSAYPSPVVIQQTGGYTISPADPDYTHQLSLVYGYASEIISTGSTLTLSYAPSSTWYDELANTASASAQLLLLSIKSGTPVASISYPVNLNVPAAIVPTASVSVSPVSSNAWISAQGLYVVGYTQARIQTTAAAGTGASVAGIAISGGLGNGSGADYTTDLLTSSGSKTVTATVTDSRGRTGTDSATVTVYDYASPNINTLAYERGSYSGGVWTQNDLGADIQITIDASLSLTGQGNTAALVITLDGSTIVSQTISASGTYTFYYTSLDPDNAHTLSAEMTDDVGNSIPKALDIPTLAVPFNIHPLLPGAAFGKIAQIAKTVEIANDWDVVRNGVSAFSSTVDLTTDVTGILPLQNGGAGSATWEDISSEIQFNKSSGSSTLSDKGAYRWGKVVQIYLSFTTSASISAGTSIWVGTMTGHLPSRIVQGATYSNNSGAQTQICRISASGGIRVQEVVGSAASGSTITFGFTYIEA